MNRVCLVLAAAAVPGMVALAVKGPPPDPVRDCTILLDPADNTLEIARRQYALELRRAGGPRPATARRLLLRIIPLQASLSALNAMNACEQRLTPCKDLIAPLETEARRREGEGKFLERIVEFLKQEATIEAMPQEERRAYYDARLYDPDAARRALAEGFTDLLPSMKAQRGRSESSRLALRPWLHVAEAASGPTPVSSLVRIVRSATFGEVEGALDPASKRQPESSITIAGYLALDALRRIGDAQAIGPLEQVLALYEPLRARDTRRRSQDRLTPPPKLSSQPSTTSYLGLMGRRIVETIGDLGDRQLERTLLGCSLWDRVNESELALVRSGALRRSEMVSD